MSIPFIASLGISSLLGPLLLPISILHLTPLLSWTFTLQWLYDEWSFHSSILSLSSVLPPDLHNLAVATYYAHWEQQGAWCSAVSVPLTWSSSLVLLYRLRTQPWHVLIPHEIAFGLSIAHVAVGNKAFPLLKQIKEGGKDGSSVQKMQRWIAMHRTRLLWLDTVAWLVFLWAGLQGIPSDS